MGASCSAYHEPKNLLSEGTQFSRNLPRQRVFDHLPQQLQLRRAGLGHQRGRQRRAAAGPQQLAELRRLGAAAVSDGDGAVRIEALARALEMDEGGGGAWPPWRCSLLAAGSFPARVIAAVRSKL